MSEKTEKPTPKKLRDARKKGQVCKSKEVGPAVLLVGVLGYLVAMSDMYIEKIERLIIVPSLFYTQPFNQALALVIDELVHAVIMLLVPIILIAVVIGVAANAAQVGVLFAGESVKPSLGKLNPAKAIKKIASPKNFIDFGKNVLKVTILGMLVYLVLRDGIGSMIKAGFCGLPCISAVFGDLMFNIIVLAIFVFVIAAAADYGLERWQYMKGLMMSKDEVKQEYKEMEGNPEIKGKRKQLHRELVQSEMVQNVRKASVVVTNPTHIAVALRYDREETPLPVVTAKGENLVAKQIIKIAQEEGIPIMENVPLAHALNEQAELDSYIPSDLIGPVAEVLRWVKQLAEENQ